MPAPVKGKIDRAAAADLMPDVHEASLLFVSGLEGDRGQTLKSSLELESDLSYHFIQSTAWVRDKAQAEIRGNNLEYSAEVWLPKATSLW